MATIARKNNFLFQYINCIIFVTIILFFSVTFIMAQENQLEKGLNKMKNSPSLSSEISISKLKPSYKVIIAPTKFVINQNEELELIFYYSGDGFVKDAKLGIYTDEKSKLINENKKEQDSYGHVNILLKADKIFSPTMQMKEVTEASILVAEVGFFINKNPLKLKPHKKYIFKSSYAGDHFIKAILTYVGEGSEWKTAEETVNIHVNSHFEKFQLIYTILGILVVLFAIFQATCLAMK
ncbi:MAG: hypothetical protein P9L96_04515 [Candidatus Gygaella obscura]|nr:hypothetical protein [Candidatus Gygaella obscura]